MSKEIHAVFLFKFRRSLFDIRYSTHTNIGELNSPGVYRVESLTFFVFLLALYSNTMLAALAKRRPFLRASA
jgi:hypothetical protein